MYLKELSINGFKSFAKKSELEFSVPITAIVGPNGSGKSNVAEAFRFVLGEQSVKSMRGKRGEDLIWGGTTQVSRGNRASVVVTLDNTKRTFNLDFDEVVIERVVHRDGQNDYRINGSSVRLKDVQELLSAANIGSTGHHIISQGEADRILSAGAIERREMVEDALGLKVYQYKKQEAEKKLVKTRSNIEQVESLRREHAPHVKYLKKQVERLEKSLAVQAELKTVYAEYLKREDVYLAHHSDRLTAELNAPRKELALVKEKLAAAKAELRAAEDVGDSKKALLQVEELVTKARQARQNCFKELSQVEGQIAYIERRVAEAKKPKATDTRQIPVVAYEKMVVKIEHDIEKALKLEDVSHLKRALTDIVHSLKVFIERVEPTVPDMAQQHEEELVTLTKNQAALAKEHAALKAAEQEAEATYHKARTAIESEAVTGREVERTIFTLVGEQRDLEATIDHIERELAILERDRDEFKREVQEAVVLLQSAAAHYFKHVIVEDGIEVTDAVIAAEDRAKQRERRRELEKLKIRLEELGQGTTDDVLKEYQAAQERDDFLAREIADLESSVTKLEQLIAELTEQLHGQFVTGIEKIAIEFNRFFVLMFGGGKADLKITTPKKRAAAEEAVDTDTETAEVVEQVGVEIDIALPNKRVKGLEMLSGGERALTSIALLFAMSQVNPPPFIILDETDAALDEANSRRYGDMIQALAEKSQLILITHNRETMSRAGVLYGVTMGMDGVSKLLSVKFDEAVAVAK